MKRLHLGATVLVVSLVLPFTTLGQPSMPSCDCSQYMWTPQQESPGDYVIAMARYWQKTIVDSEGDVGRYSSLAIQTAGAYAGLPAIAYCELRANGDHDLKYACWDGTDWQLRTLHDDPYADVGAAACLAFASVDGQASISCQQRTGQELVAARTVPPNENEEDWWWESWWSPLHASTGEATSVKFLVEGDWTRPVVAFHGRILRPNYYPPTYVGGLIFRDYEADVASLVEEGGWVGYRCSMGIRPNGQIAIAYTGDYGGANPGTLMYAWSDDQGLTWDHLEVAPGRTGWFPSLAILPSGDPAIAYHDGDTGCLKFAWRGGNDWYYATIDADAVVGTYPSLAILSNGQPAISYAKGEEDAPEELRYARHIGTSDFDVGWHVEVVDRAGQVGSYSSLAILPDGDPAISYYDQTNGDLKCAVRTNQCPNSN